MNKNYLLTEIASNILGVRGGGDCTPPPSNSFENTSRQLGLGLDSCIVFQMAICISFYSTIFKVRIWPMQCSLGNLNTIRHPPVAAIDFDSLRMCESWGSNKLSFLVSQASFS